MRQPAGPGTVEEGNVHLSGVCERSPDVSTDTALLTDDVLVGDLRDECERWATRDELEAGFARLFALRVPLSNAKARQELGWAPMYPSYREGLRQTVARAA